MEFSVNHIDDEVTKLSQKDTAFIKYPGSICDIDTLKNLLKLDFKILLHGIAPSSGSLLDPTLLINFEEFSKIIKQTNQRWLSFHFDYRTSYNQPDYIPTLESNLKIIRNKFPNTEIIIENLPPLGDIELWSTDSKLVNTIANKYNLKLLLDTAHAMVAADRFGISYEEYISNLDLDKVVEIHFSGTAYKNGILTDSHTAGSDKEFELLEYTIKKCPNLRMVTFEYIPKIKHTNLATVGGVTGEFTAKQLYAEQQEQLDKIKAICKKLNR